MGLQDRWYRRERQRPRQAAAVELVVRKRRPCLVTWLARGLACMGVVIESLCVGIAAGAAVLWYGFR